MRVRHRSLYLGPPPRCGMWMLNAALHAAKHRAARQQIQNQKLLSDVAIDTFRGDNNCTLSVLRQSECGLEMMS